MNIEEGTLLYGVNENKVQIRIIQQTGMISENRLAYNRGLQIDKDSSWDVLAGTGLAEEGVEGVITASDGLITGHLTIRLDAVLQAVQLPAGIANLDSGLAHVDGDAFTLR